jgi:P4 family phage/plasmid primase-like protien
MKNIAKHYKENYNLVPITGNIICEKGVNKEHKRFYRSSYKNVNSDNCMEYVKESDNCIAIRPIDSGLIVLDIDDTNEWEEFKEKNNITDPNTVSENTRNGYHFYFKTNPDKQYKQNIKFQGNNFDIIYKTLIYMTPTKYTLLDDTVFKYNWVNGKGIDDIDIMFVPEWLETLMDNETTDIIEKIEDLPLYKLNNTEIHGIKCFINQTYVIPILDINQIYICLEYNNITISLHTMFCHFVNRLHTSNHQYIIIDKYSIKQKCHACEGKYKEVKYINYPENIKTIINVALLDNDNYKVKQECELYLKNEIGCGNVNSLVKKESGYEGILLNASNMLNFSHKAICSKCKTFVPIIFLSFEQGGIGVKCKNCLFQYPEEIVAIKQEQYPILYQTLNITNNLTINNNVTIQKDLILNNDERLVIVENSEINTMLYQALDGRERKLVEIVAQESKNIYKYCDKKWYNYDGIVWKVLGYEPIEIVNSGNKSLIKYYELMCEKYKSANNLSVEKMEILENYISKMINKLDSDKWSKSFENLSKACFIDREFLDKLNKNGDIICFNDCVYELETGIKRNGDPNDYSSFKIHMDFPETDTVKREKLMDILNSIIPDKPTLHYVLKHLSSCLSGNIKENRLHIWTANGSNGKSTLNNLCEMAFGDYSVCLKSAVLTDNGFINNPDSATTSLNPIENKRLVTMQETQKGIKLNETFVKMFTGGDKLKLRRLHAEERTVVPMHKPILSTNDLPEIIGRDHGIWRRMFVINFGMTFLPKYQYDNLSEVEKLSHGIIDINLEKSLDNLVSEFMCLLIEYYPIYKSEGLVPSEQIEKDSAKYREENDIILEFIKNCCDVDLENKNNYKVFSSDLLNAFIKWKKLEEIRQRFKNQEFFEEIEKRIISKRSRIFIDNERKIGWYGIQLKNEE